MYVVMLGLILYLYCLGSSIDTLPVVESASSTLGRREQRKKENEMLAPPLITYVQSRYTSY